MVRSMPGTKGAHPGSCDPIPFVRGLHQPITQQRLFLAHGILRQIMSDAAVPSQLEPDRLSFVVSLRILQSHLHQARTCAIADWYRRLLEEVGSVAAECERRDAVRRFWLG